MGLVVSPSRRPTLPLGVARFLIRKRVRLATFRLGLVLPPGRRRTLPLEVARFLIKDRSPTLPTPPHPTWRPTWRTTWHYWRWRPSMMTACDPGISLVKACDLGSLSVIPRRVRMRASESEPTRRLHSSIHHVASSCNPGIYLKGWMSHLHSSSVCTSCGVFPASS